MARSQIQGEDEERLSEDEVARLRKLAPSNSGDAQWPLDLTRLQDVAEATGQAEEDVRAQLRAIRAEQAFTGSSPGFQVPVVPLVAVGVLALGIAYLVLHPQKDLIPTGGHRGESAPVPSVSPAPNGPTRSRPQGNFLPASGFGYGPEKGPPGLVVELSDQNMTFGGSNLGSGHAPPLDYERECQWIESAAEAMVNDAKDRITQAVPKPPGPYRDQTGALFTPRPGYYRLLLSGWPGTVTDWIPVSFDAAAKQLVLQDAKKLLQVAKQAQDNALDLSVVPTKGVVTPPPGYEVDFYGRRFDRQQGPPLAFVPVDPGVVKSRLELAIRNAILRDGKPPIGPWTRNAEAEAKIPRPPMSHVELTGPGGASWSFDVPTGRGWDSASAAAVRVHLGSVGDQVAHVNRLGEDASAGN